MRPQHLLTLLLVSLLVHSAFSFSLTLLTDQLSDTTQRFIRNVKDTIKETKCKNTHDDGMLGLTCGVAIDGSIMGTKLNFTSAFVIQADFTTEKALISLRMDDMVVERKVSFKELNVPICVSVPWVSSLGKICLRFNNIKMHTKRQCFRSDVSLTLGSMFGNVPLISPQEFGWNMNACKSITVTNLMSTTF